MIVRRTLTLALTLASSLLWSPAPAAARADAPGALVVTLAPGASIADLNARYGTETLGAIEGANVYKLDAPGAGRTLERLRRDPAVARASRDGKVRRHEGYGFPFDEPVTVDGDGAAAFAGQVDDAGALGSLGARAASALAAGREPVVVAVLDTGADLSHPAVAPFLWSNAAEASGAPGVDDDRDGLVDDVRGYDFVRGSPDVDEAGATGALAGHGTFISSLVGLAAPSARVMPLRVLDSDGAGSAFDAAAAINYAIRHGARVVSMSFGADSRYVPPVLVDAVRSASAQGVVLVAASGNDGDRVLPFPASDAEDVIAVGASDGARRASFSNYSPRTLKVGAWAPGSRLVGAMPGGGYATWSGTSFATALVSAISATLLSVSPTETPQTVRAHLTQETGSVYLSDIGRWQVSFVEAVESALRTLGPLQVTATSSLAAANGAAGGSVTVRSVRDDERTVEIFSINAAALDPDATYRVSVQALGFGPSFDLGPARSDALGNLAFTATRGAGGDAPLPFPASALTSLTVSTAGGAAVRRALLGYASGAVDVAAQVGLRTKDGALAPLGVAGYSYARGAVEILTVQSSGLEAGATYAVLVDGVEVARGTATPAGGTGSLAVALSTDPSRFGPSWSVPMPASLRPITSAGRVDVVKVGAEAAGAVLTASFSLAR